MKQFAHISTLQSSSNDSTLLWFKQWGKSHRSFQGCLRSIGVGWNQCRRFIQFAVLRISFVLGFITFRYFFIWAEKSFVWMLCLRLLISLSFLTSLRTLTSSVVSYLILTFSTLLMIFRFIIVDLRQKLS